MLSPRSVGQMPVTQRLARLVVHADCDIGVNHLGGSAQLWTFTEQWVDQRLVAVQQERRVRPALMGDFGPGYGHARTVIASHGIERHSHWSVHQGKQGPTDPASCLANRPAAGQFGTTIARSPRDTTGRKWR